MSVTNSHFSCHLFVPYNERNAYSMVCIFLEMWHFTMKNIKVDTINTFCALVRRLLKLSGFFYIDSFSIQLFSWVALLYEKETIHTVCT